MEPSKRIAQLAELLGWVEPIPEEWAPGRTKKSSASGGTEIECLPCDNWEDLRMAWRKALKWTDGLDAALSVMLAASASTRMLGDQIWVKIIGPPSCGKSVLCEALSINREYVYAKSSIRGFHSGYQTSRSGDEDHSLIPKLKNKTLVTKDGDTLLQAPNRAQILSEGRDLYDTVSRSHYRNATSRDYTGVRFTWVLCGTESLRVIDASELGERFLDCVIMESIDDELEDEICDRKIQEVINNKAMEVNGQADSMVDPDLLEAMQKTGGYINYLRVNAVRLFGALEFPREAAVTCKNFGKFVSYMRARPSKLHDEHHGREMSARLTSQLGRLASSLAVVMNRPAVDKEVIGRVRKVALDTARGKVREIARIVYHSNSDGVENGGVAHQLSEDSEKTLNLLRFMRRLGMVVVYTKEFGVGVRGRPRFRMTAKFKRLYQSVTGEHVDGSPPKQRDPDESREQTPDDIPF
jgi:hypothetical protein